MISTPVSATCIQVRGGAYLDLLNPDPDHIHLDDIAHALGNLGRYTGHTSKFYSVAQHCVLCCQNAPPESAWAALMHDAAEAYIGDVSRPLKQLLPIYKTIEARLEAVIFAKFHVVIDENVKRLDMEALNTERRDLMPNTGGAWECASGYGIWSTEIYPLKPLSSSLQFRKEARAHMPQSLKN